MEVTLDLGTSLLAYAGIKTGAKVATINIDGGNAPYTVTVGTGYTHYEVVEENGTFYVATKNVMDVWSMQEFDVICTDSTGAIDYSPKAYPRFATPINSKFNKENAIYKIVKEHNLLNGVLPIPAGCTLDFQGGKLTNVRLELNDTKIAQNGFNIEDYISGTITGTYKEGQVLYDSSLKKQKLWNGSSWVNLDGSVLE